MVGVPGRSRGCHTCRQRRIRCSEEKPQCSNCIKSKRVCGGYRPKHAFILSQEMLSLDPSPSQATSEREESGALMVTRWRAQPKKSSKDTKSLDITSLYRLQQGHIKSSLPYALSSRHAARQQIFDFFIRNHLPSEVLDNRSSISQQSTWLLDIADISVSTSVLETSIMAVCIARLGRINDSKALCRESLHMYTKGLHQLQQALRNPETRYNEETAAACMALILYESTACQSQHTNGYLSHYQGAMNLLRLRGAEAHASGLRHSIFQDLRNHAVWLGIYNRSRTFFAEPEWRTLPWKSSNKSLRDMLIDILLEIPELYHQADLLDTRCGRSENISGLINVVELCWWMDAQLNNWYSKLESFLAGPVYWPTLSTVDSPIDDMDCGKVFAIAFHFPSYDVAQVVIMYWLGLALLHQHMCFMYTKLESWVGMGEENTRCSCMHVPTPKEADLSKPTITICPRHFTMNQLPPLGDRPNWAQGPARKICQSAEYLMQDKMGGIGSSVILGRLLVVRVLLVFAASGDWTREISWITDLVTKIQAKGYWNMDLL